MIEMLVGGSSLEKAKQRSLLASLPDVDWRERTCVPLYLCNLVIGIGEVNLEDAVNTLSQGLMLAFCAEPPRLYLGHR